MGSGFQTILGIEFGVRCRAVLTGRYHDRKCRDPERERGQLLGASSVDAGGTLYNVEFLDGTCIDLYSGCDEVSDFTFQSFGAAQLASQALLDQVFIDGVDGLFDSDPTLIN